VTEEDVGLNLVSHDREDRADREGRDDSTVTSGSADPRDATDDDEVEPVELLVQLAEEGEIEPWDIDIVAVTDKFLTALDDADLRTSGRALFYASVLLRMKSDALLSDDEPEEPVVEPWEVPPGEEPIETGYDPIDALEQEMDRRLDRKNARGTPETLDELVRDLRDAERESSWWQRRRTYDTSDSPHGFGRGVQTLDYRTGDDMRLDDEPTEDDITGTAHNEDIEAVIDEVRAVLAEQYEAGREEVLYTEIEGAGGSPILTFLALLFLANRDFVLLDQDEVFGDLWIQDAMAAAREPGEAIAD